MRITRVVLLSRLVIDRLPLGPTSLRYANLMRDGIKFPPIKCALRADGRLQILDGRHRFLAAKLSGQTGLSCRYSTEVLRGTA